jgi:hypothetical protein
LTKKSQPKNARDSKRSMMKNEALLKMQEDQKTFDEKRGTLNRQGAQKTSDEKRGSLKCKGLRRPLTKKRYLNNHTLSNQKSNKTVRLSKAQSPLTRRSKEGVTLFGSTAIRHKF